MSLSGAPAMPGPIPVRHWRAIWISDVHLGCKYARVDALLDFLRGNRSRYLYLAGDFIDGWEFDGLTSMNRLLERVGARIYDWVLGPNHQVHPMRSRLGVKHWSLAASLKGGTKAAIRYITEYEDALARLAERRGVEGVICGHIHRAEIARIGSLAYLNCGDWVESCTALAEDAGGNFHVIAHHENPADGPGRGAGPLDSSHRRLGDAIAVRT